MLAQRREDIAVRQRDGSRIQQLPAPQQSHRGWKGGSGGGDPFPPASVRQKRREKMEVQGACRGRGETVREARRR
jgi:hypothetical protein